MEINDATIEKLSTLSKLNFNAEEKIGIKKDLQNMLGLIEKMNELNTDGVEPLLFMNAHENVMRDDVVQGSITNEEALKNTAHKNAPYFIVPTIIKK